MVGLSYEENEKLISGEGEREREEEEKERKNRHRVCGGRAVNLWVT